MMSQWTVIGDVNFNTTAIDGEGKTIEGIVADKETYSMGFAGEGAEAVVQAAAG